MKIKFFPISGLQKYKIKYKIKKMAEEKNLLKYLIMFKVK